MRLFAGIVLLAGSGVLFAATEPESIAVGGAELIPTIRIQHQHDDNIFSSAIREESSTITNLTPRLEYLAEKDANNRLSISYDGDWARYWQSRDDDYIDHTFTIAGAYSGNDSYKLKVDAATAKLHDNRGEGASEGVGGITRTEPDEYDQDTFSVGLDLGKEGARFGAYFGVDTLAKEYTNNRNATRFRDRDDRGFVARLFTRISGKTRGFIGYRNTDIEYSSLTASGVTLDSDESSVLAGVEWEATGKTTGSLEVGRLTKDFDEPGSEEQDLTVWNLGVQWAPREYSIVSFNTVRDAAETNGIGAYIEQTNHTVNWVHGWSERISSTIAATIGDDEYPGSTREDDRADYTIGVDYDWQRWASIGFRMQYSDRDSNVDLFDFDRRRIFVTLDLSL
ncbi:MAG: outer membrane beta-barrel protein [Pseudomonadales bacterium]|nr:outer membrane beta-barrel protein [Pseudomonadales bacterium]